MGVLSDKEVEYRRYIDNHITNVYKAWRDYQWLFYDFIDNSSAEYNILRREIINHDLSKYSKDEFEPYRKNFYPISDKEKENNKGDFEMALEHHYANNSHHWNYWVGSNGEAKEMDDISIVHMICDWIAMGYQFNNTAYEYYEKNKDNINLAPGSRMKVEKILDKMANGLVH